MGDKGAQTQSRPLNGEVEASQGTNASQSPAVANVARVQQDQPKAYSYPERARRIAVTELPPDADARLTAAIKALRSYELRYGSFRGNLYLAVLATMDWNSARGWAEIAEGHLVTLSDQDENEFVFELFARDVRFIHVGVKGMDVNGPWIGLFQPAGSREPGGGWMWITGESLRYKNWNNGEPNNFEGDDNSGVFYSLGARNPKEEQRPNKWDDRPSYRYAPGFIVEIEGDQEKARAYLAFETQTELIRLGCMTGKMDGRWGPNSQKALHDFAARRDIELSSDVPSVGLLARMRESAARVCFQE